MFEDVILKRRSYRTFSTKSVEKDVEEKLLTMTLRAPSGGNMQLWSMIRVVDPEKKAVLAKTCDNQAFIAKAPLVYFFLSDAHKWLEYFKASDCEGKFNKSIRKPGLGDFHLGMQDALAAAQTCVLAAEALGLRSCYIGDIIENYETVKEVFHLPEYAAPACLLVLGYPKEEIKAEYLPRPNNEDFYFTDEYPELTGERLSAMYRNQEEYSRKNKTLPLNNTGTYADRYFEKKYTSAFMKEMNRSAKVFLEVWMKDS